MRRNFDRTQRLADLIKKALATILLEEMSDERFRLVTVTGAVVSRDLAYAKIYVTVLMDEEEKIKQVVDALNYAAKSIRYSLAHAVKLRVVPELKFVFDESTAHGFKISGLIDSVTKKDK